MMEHGEMIELALRSWSNGCYGEMVETMFGVKNGNEQEQSFVIVASKFILLMGNAYDLATGGFCVEGEGAMWWNVRWAMR